MAQGVLGSPVPLLMAETFIYTLVDPRYATIRYVGKSDNPDKRVDGHFKEQLHRWPQSNPIFRNWLKGLQDDGLRPLVMIVDEVAKDAWQEQERWWISTLRASGFALLNRHEGGRGGATRTGKKLSEEAKAKIRANWGKKKEPKSNTSRINFGKNTVNNPHRFKPGHVPWNKGRPWSKSERQKFSKAHQGKEPSNKGKPMSTLQRAKLRAAWRVRKMRSEFYGMKGGGANGSSA